MAGISFVLANMYDAFELSKVGIVVTCFPLENLVVVLLLLSSPFKHVPHFSNTFYSLSPQLPHPPSSSPFAVWLLRCWLSLGHRVPKTVCSRHLKGVFLELFFLLRCFQFLHIEGWKTHNSLHSFISFILSRGVGWYESQSFYLWYPREGNDRKVSSD